MTISQQPTPADTGPVECLGLTFADDEARRAYFTEKLRQKLQEPDFRNIKGFPRGEDEDILALSDPPYYTACPNPFVEAFLRHYGQPYNPEVDDYHQTPLTLELTPDNSEPLYALQADVAKVPPAAIVRAILHYTRPGDVILDGFAGSGMTGLAAHWCAQPPAALQQTIAAEWTTPPPWGPRRVILNDLSPRAGFIAASYSLPFDLAAFTQTALRLLAETEQDLGWMYQTQHPAGEATGEINFTVWSEEFLCPHCNGLIPFFRHLYDEQTLQFKLPLICPHCAADLTDRPFRTAQVTYLDPLSGASQARPTRRPVLINYTVGEASFEKEPDQADLQALREIEVLSTWPESPARPVPAHYLRPQRFQLDTHPVPNIHLYYLPRAAYTLTILWQKIQEVADIRLRHVLMFWFEARLTRLSVRNRYSPPGSAAVSPISNHFPPVMSEENPLAVYKTAVQEFASAFAGYSPTLNQAIITTGDAGDLSAMADNSVDYIFTEPPDFFHPYYSGLNSVREAWYRVWTNPATEVINDQANPGRLLNYRQAMQRCFDEYCRLLKPGRWLTLVFPARSGRAWKLIQEVLVNAGFVVAGAYTSDQTSGRVRKAGNAKSEQDIIISAYKPTLELEHQFEQHGGSVAGVWAFVAAHLRQLPLLIRSAKGVVYSVDERQNYALFERMVAFHQQRQVTPPMSALEFYTGLEQRFAARDGMYFLPDQIVEYDRQRLEARPLQPIKVHFIDETQFIRWVQSRLHQKPQKFSELRFGLERTQGRPNSFKLPELNDILAQNFLRYDGEGPIPEPIWNWLKQSAEFGHQTREPVRETAAPSLRTAAKGRWYLPDSDTATVLERRRQAVLLKELQAYVRSRQISLKPVRPEILRAGVEKAFQEKDYRTIVKLVSIIPDQILLEYPRLLFWYDQAVARMENQI